MSPNDPNRGLKVLTRELVERAGGLDAAGVCTRVKKSSLSNYANVHLPETFVPVDVVARLEEIAGEPLVTRELARRARCALVPIEPVTEGELASLLARVGAESGAVFAAYADAVADDGRVDAPERAGIARELSDLVRAATAALGHLQASPAPVAHGERGTA
jgi:predicted transcriptional regulator